MLNHTRRDTKLLVTVVSGMHNATVFFLLQTRASRKLFLQISCILLLHQPERPQACNLFLLHQSPQLFDNARRTAKEASKQWKKLTTTTLNNTKPNPTTFHITTRKANQIPSSSLSQITNHLHLSTLNSSQPTLLPVVPIYIQTTPLPLPLLHTKHIQRLLPPFICPLQHPSYTNTPQFIPKRPQAPTVPLIPKHPQSLSPIYPYHLLPIIIWSIY